MQRTMLSMVSTLGTLLVAARMHALAAAEDLPPWVQVGPTPAAGYVGLCAHDPSQLCKDGKPHVLKGVH